VLVSVPLTLGTDSEQVITSAAYLVKLILLVAVAQPPGPRDQSREAVKHDKASCRRRGTVVDELLADDVLPLLDKALMAV